MAEDNSCLPHQLLVLGSTDHQGHSEGTPGAGKTWNIVPVFPSFTCSTRGAGAGLSLDCHPIQLQWQNLQHQGFVGWKKEAQSTCGVEKGMRTMVSLRLEKIFKSIQSNCSPSSGGHHPTLVPKCYIPMALKFLQDSTASLGSLCQGWTALSMEKLSLVSNLNHPAHLEAVSSHFLCSCTVQRCGGKVTPKVILVLRSCQHSIRISALQADRCGFSNTNLRNCAVYWFVLVSDPHCSGWSSRRELLSPCAPGDWI